MFRDETNLVVSGNISFIVFFLLKGKLLLITDRNFWRVILLLEDRYFWDLLTTLKLYHYFWRGVAFEGWLLSEFYSIVRTSHK